MMREDEKISSKTVILDILENAIQRVKNDNEDYKHIIVLLGTDEESETLAYTSIKHHIVYLLTDLEEIIRKHPMLKVLIVDWFKKYF